MQTLYSLGAMDVDMTGSDAVKGRKILNEKLNQSLDLFTVAVLYVTSVAQYAEQDARQRAAKYLPTLEDKDVNTRIAGNTFLWQILEEPTFKEKIQADKLDRYISPEWIKKLYQELAKTPEYEAYIALPARDAKSEKAIMQFIWEGLIQKNESLQEYFLDEVPGWEDDKEMATMLMQNFFRNPAKTNFLNLLTAEKREYAYDLLRIVLEKEDYTMELITPHLTNWEADRVALIDMLLLRMGICELLYFPTIPPVVTINEYIEVAKQYSTPQSGHFVNAIMDHLLKELTQQDKIHKQERNRK